jgi:heme oxygenase
LKARREDFYGWACPFVSLSSASFIKDTHDHFGKNALRSQRLNQITHEPHSKLDALVKAHAPFETRANFARFVVAQYLFQSELVRCTTTPIDGHRPGPAAVAAPKRPRLTWRTSTPNPGTGRWRPAPSEQSPALGWIFVSEGSKLGAAFLIKRAVAWAERNLRRPPPGRTGRWPRRRLEKLRAHPRLPAVHRRRGSRSG